MLVVLEQTHLIGMGHLATARNVVVLELGHLGIGQFLADHTVDPALERWPLQTQGLDLRIGPGTALGTVFHDEFTSDFHDVDFVAIEASSFYSAVSFSQSLGQVLALVASGSYRRLPRLRGCA